MEAMEAAGSVKAMEAAAGSVKAQDMVRRRWWMHQNHMKPQPSSIHSKKIRWSYNHTGS